MRDSLSYGDLSSMLQTIISRFSRTIGWLDAFNVSCFMVSGVRGMVGRGGVLYASARRVANADFRAIQATFTGHSPQFIIDLNIANTISLRHVE